MFKSAGCLAQANKLDEMARLCLTEGARQALTQAATEWRRLAAITLEQEAREALNPATLEASDGSHRTKKGVVEE